MAMTWLKDTRCTESLEMEETALFPPARWGREGVTVSRWLLWSVYVMGQCVSSGLRGVQCILPGARNLGSGDSRNRGSDFEGVWLPG